jgi:hypothetical protein
MKVKIIFALVLLLLAADAFAARYRVISINGRVTCRGAVLTRNAYFDSNNPNADLRLSRGSTIRYGQESPRSNQVFTATAQPSCQGDNCNGNFASRSIPAGTRREELDAFLSGATVELNDTQINNIMAVSIESNVRMDKATNLNDKVMNDRVLVKPNVMTTPALDKNKVNTRTRQ